MFLSGEIGARPGGNTTGKEALQYEDGTEVFALRREPQNKNPCATGHTPSLFPNPQPIPSSHTP